MKPILFSAEMVRAIQDLRKTQTRRVVKAPVLQDVREPNKVYWKNGKIVFNWCGETVGWFEVKPKYQPGDILWVRESWCENRGKYFYKADNICNGCTEDGICLPEGVAKHITCELCEDRDGYIKWRSPMFMPREAARIFLRVKTVRVERLHEITDADILAEGFECREDFIVLWNILNEKRGHGWNKNDWVYAYTFEKISREEAKRLEGMK
jgi:hypothetical protein